MNSIDGMSYDIADKLNKRTDTIILKYAMDIGLKNLILFYDKQSITENKQNIRTHKFTLKDPTNKMKPYILCTFKIDETKPHSEDIRIFKKGLNRIASTFEKLNIVYDETVNTSIEFNDNYEITPPVLKTKES